MPRKSLGILILLATISLWSMLPQTVFAQDITSTPEPGTSAGTENLAESTATATDIVNEISVPEQDALLSGIVEIKGTALFAWGLSFSYKDNPTDTWFPLAQSDQSVSDGLLATWDTTSIADGSYTLRLHILDVTGAQDKVVMLRVGNHLPDATQTSTPTLTPGLELIGTSLPEQFVASAEETQLPAFATATRLPKLPANPAVLNPDDVFINLGRGVLGVLLVFGFAGLVLSLRRR